MMDQCRMWRTEGGVLENVKIGHGDDADVDEEEEASQTDDRSTQNVEDWGHSMRVWRLESIFQTCKIQ